MLLTQAIASEETLDQSMPADDLLLLEGMSPDLALALARRGVRTREDLAEQSVDDLADIEGLAAEEAGKLIMTARAPGSRRATAPEEDKRMAEVTVSQFAEVLKVPVDRLLVQLDQAGIKVSGPDARISDDAKLELLTHLRRSHGSEDAGGDAAPRKITLKRKTQSELKLASTQGRARTVNVEVRRKRTYIKRDVLEEQARAAAGRDRPRKARGRGGRARRRAERAEAERRERERLEAGEPPPHRGRGSHAARAQEEARRVAEQRARDDEARRSREREETERRATERERPQPAPVAAPVRERPARVAPAPAADDKHTRYGRQELHVAGDVSSRYKKKRRAKSRPVPSGAEGTARLRDADRAGGARGRHRRDDHRGGAGAEDGGQGHRGHQGADEHGRHGHHQPADRPGHRGAGGRGNGPHRRRC